MNPVDGDPELMIDALNRVFGREPHARALHAKGIVVAGSFTPAPEAAAVSRAAHLRGATVPVTARFSNFSGTPSAPDFESNAGPRGMAVKFWLPDGTHTDVVAHSFNGFPAATADEFRQCFLALAASGPSAPSPTAAERFFATHPAAKAFFEASQPLPLSYVTLTYFGVHAFAFTNAQGRTVHGRYRLEPAAGTQYLAADDHRRAAPGYLQEELRERMRVAPVVFTLALQLAAEGDAVGDASVAWSDSNPELTLGTLHLTRLADDVDAAGAPLAFSPANLTDGIEAADPMVRERCAAYAASVNRRRR